jgi:hypothetical protein
LFLAIAHEKSEKLSPDQPTRLLTKEDDGSCCVSMENRNSINQVLAERLLPPITRDLGELEGQVLTVKWLVPLRLRALCHGMWVLVRQFFFLSHFPLGMAMV